MNRGCEPGGGCDHWDAGTHPGLPLDMCNSRHERLDDELGLESEQHGVGPSAHWRRMPYMTSPLALTAIG